MSQLYLISPPRFELAAFARQLEEALSANRESADTKAKKTVGAFQLRMKEASDAEIVEAIKTLKPICRDKEVAFIINDRPDLCAKYKLDGVHVGQEDLVSASGTRYCASHEAPLKAGESADSQASIRRIRNTIGSDAVIGVTCHASRHLAMEAGEAGADYVAFGAFYPTTSKPKEKLEKWGTPTRDILQWWSEYMTLPCVAIGGITPANCAPLIEAGADFIAVITAVWNHPKGAKKAVEEFNTIFARHGRSGDRIHN